MVCFYFSITEKATPTASTSLCLSTPNSPTVANRLPPRKVMYRMAAQGRPSQFITPSSQPPHFMSGSSEAPARRLKGVPPEIRATRVCFAVHHTLPWFIPTVLRFPCRKRSHHFVPEKPFQMCLLLTVCCICMYVLDSNNAIKCFMEKKKKRFQCAVGY